MRCANYTVGSWGGSLISRHCQDGPANPEPRLAAAIDGHPGPLLLSCLPPRRYVGTQRRLRWLMLSFPKLNGSENRSRSPNFFASSRIRWIHLSKAARSAWVRPSLTAELCTRCNNLPQVTHFPTLCRFKCCGSRLRAHRAVKTKTAVRLRQEVYTVRESNLTGDLMSATSTTSISRNLAKSRLGRHSRHWRRSPSPAHRDCLGGYGPLVLRLGTGVLIDFCGVVGCRYDCFGYLWCRRRSRGLLPSKVADKGQVVRALLFRPRRLYEAVGFEKLRETRCRLLR